MMSSSIPACKKKKVLMSLIEANETHRSLRCNKKINYEQEEKEGGK